MSSQVYFDYSTTNVSSVTIGKHGPQVEANTVTELDKQVDEFLQTSWKERWKESAEHFLLL
jgi:hypothetical protein